MPAYLATGGSQAGGRHRRPDAPLGSYGSVGVTPVRPRGTIAETSATPARRDIPVATPAPQGGGRHRRPDAPLGSYGSLGVTPVRPRGTIAETSATPARRDIPVPTPAPQADSPQSWAAIGMRLCLRSMGIAVLAIVAAVLLALTSTTTSVYTLAAATYILPGLVNYPFIPQADIDLATPYIADTTGTPPPTPPIVDNYPAMPPPAGGIGGIESGSVIFGYSQNALTTYKQAFNQFWADNPGVPPDITFVLIGNADRPNGGSFARANLGATPTVTAGAAPAQITTYDIARQYDGVADYPTNPLNLLADANASLGFFLVHLEYGSVNMSQALPQGTFGDTNYFLIPTYPLPLLMPLDLIPLAGPVLADMLDPPLRVLVEAGYDRTINPGVPTPFNVAYSPDPTALVNNFDLAVSTGFDNALEDLGLGRPSGTVRPGPYGVDGPPVTVAATSMQQPATPAASLSGALSDSPSLPSPTTLTTDLAPVRQRASTPQTSTSVPSTSVVSDPTVAPQDTTVPLSEAPVPPPATQAPAPSATGPTKTNGLDTGTPADVADAVKTITPPVAKRGGNTASAATPSTTAPTTGSPTSATNANKAATDNANDKKAATGKGNGNSGGQR